MAWSLVSGAVSGATTVHGMLSSRALHAPPLRHVAGGCREHATLKLGRRQMSQRIGRPANFERADRLEILQLQVDFDRQVKTIQPNERRAQGRPGDVPACL